MVAVAVLVAAAAVLVALVLYMVIALVVISTEVARVVLEGRRLVALEAVR